MKKPAAQHRQTTHAVGAKAKPARPAAPASSATGGKGTPTHKHHSAPAKHQPRKARKWSPDSDLALCSVRAVATALAAPLSDEDLAAAYLALTTDPDAGVPIGAAIRLLGGRLLLPVLGVTWPQPHAVAVAADGRWWSWGELYDPWTDAVDEVWA